MKIRKIIALVAIGASTLVFSFTGLASAHVVVSPGDVKTGAYQTFILSVSAERDDPTTSVKLDIPESLASVTPTVKPGWTVQTEKHGEDAEAMISAITWTGGEIEPGYRDEFTFRAKTPDKSADLQWKAYQTYQNGVVVSWDQQPDVKNNEGSEGEETKTTGPFSVTKVASASDQDVALKNADSQARKAQQTADTALYTSIGGIILVLLAVIVAATRKRL